MKILIITQLYPGTPDKNRKDPRLAIHAFVKHWATLHDVQVIRQHNYRFFTAWIWWFRRLPSEYTMDGVRVYNRLVIRWPLGGWSHHTIHKVVRAYRPDLVVAHILESVHSANAVFHRYGIPYAMGLHNSDIRKSGAISGQVTARAHRLMRDAVHVSFWSERIRRIFLDQAPYLAGKSGIITGGIPAHWISSSKREFDFTMGRIRIVTVSRLLRQKNIHKVIRALAGLTDVDFEYHIIGDGHWPYPYELKRLIRQSHLRDRVYLDGLKQPEEVLQALKDADIMVMISENETFGLVYLEAMSQGCLTIGTRGEGIDGVIVDGKNGYLCDPTATALSALLKQIVTSDPQILQSLSLEAQETAANYRQDKLSDNYLKEILKRV